MSGQIVVVGEGAVTNDVAEDETKLDCRSSAELGSLAVRIETRLAICLR